MTIAVLADEQCKQSWQRKSIPPEVEVLWCGSVKTLVATVADAYADMLFIQDKERISQLRMRAGFPFLINAVEHTNADTGEAFIRINAWPGFFEREWVEVVANGEEKQHQVKEIFAQLNWKYQLVPDIPGMITPRIIASIINEAYYTFGDGISSKEEIDIAMKLGTNYPFGPFEWCERIGPERIHSLLKKMEQTDSRYTIAPALEKEILQTHIQ